jgi:hypothetical protein
MIEIKVNLYEQPSDKRIVPENSVKDEQEAAPLEQDVEAE